MVCENTVTELRAQRPATDFWRSLAIQLRVIGAVTLREIVTRHGRNNIGFMWIFVEPMMFTVGVVSVWSLFHASEHNTPLVPFLVTGYGTVLMWRNTIGRAGESIRSNKPLMFHRNVRPIDIFVASLLLEIGGATISFIALSAFFTFVGMMDMPHDILKMIVGWFLLTWFSFAMGMIVGSLGVFSEIYLRVWHVFAYLFLPMCGAFSMLDWLPTRAQDWLLLVPTVSCVELMRDGYFGEAVRTHYRLFYVLCADLGLLLLGLRLVMLAARELEDGAV